MSDEKIQAVIFDLDGVLIDTTRNFWKIHDILSAFPFSLLFFGQPKNGWRSLSRSQGENVLKVEGWSVWRAELYFRIWYFLEGLYKPEIFYGAYRLIMGLKHRNKVIGILTNRTDGRRTKRIFALKGLPWLDFNFIVSLKNKKSGFFMRAEKILPNQFYSLVSKPNPLMIKPVRFMLKNLPGYPASVLYVGDNLIDFYFARDNGFSFIGVLSGEIKNPEIWRQAGVTTVINSVNDLNERFEQYF